jgi:hypothetical protein
MDQQKEKKEQKQLKQRASRIPQAFLRAVDVHACISANTVGAIYSELYTVSKRKRTKLLASMPSQNFHAGKKKKHNLNTNIEKKITNLAHAIANKQSCAETRPLRIRRRQRWSGRCLKYIPAADE